MHVYMLLVYVYFVVQCYMLRVLIVLVRVSRCMNGCVSTLCVYVSSMCFVSMSGCDENGCLA